MPPIRRRGGVAPAAAAAGPPACRPTRTASGPRSSAAATASNQAMISAGSLRVLAVQRPPLEDPLDALGHVQPRPAQRRVQRHDPVGEQPQTNSGVLCPARLSSTSSIRNGGSSAGSVGLIDQALLPPLPRRPRRVGRRRAASGSAARMADSSRFSQGCSTAFGQVVAPSTRTRPSAGWNRVSTLAVPSRTYSCGCRAGSPSGRQDGPGCGTVWNGPASSSHQTASPSASPSAVGVLDQLFFGSASGSVTIAAPGLAAAQGRAGRAPGAGPLEGVAGPVEDLPDGERRDRGQAVGGRPQRLAQGRAATRWRCRRPPGSGSGATSRRIRVPGRRVVGRPLARRRGGASRRPGPRG